jgi:membrane dipeptidase
MRPPATTSADAATWARALGVSREAVEVHRAAGVVDLHVESFIWTRLAGYRLDRQHEHTLLGGRLFGQADVPRMRAAGLGGAVMSIATNPFRPLQSRRKAVRVNVARLRRVLMACDGVDVVADAPAFDRARARGRLACFLALQGANALTPDDLGGPALADVSRITLVHLTRSRHGAASAPLGGDRGLRPEGARMIEAMRANGVLLDLAHAAPSTFWQALDIHGSEGPVIVSHTGVRAQHPSWRNVDDDQIRAIAARDGVVGVILHRGFLTSWGRSARAADVARHIDHIVRIGGERTAALGSDYDGFILPPADLRSVTELPRVVQALLDLGHPPDRIMRILGENPVRPLRAARPGPTASAVNPSVPLGHDRPDADPPRHDR